MLIVQTLDHQWGEKAPHPSIETLAKRLGITSRAVRHALASLTKSGFVAKVPGPNGRNRFVFKGLFDALEQMMREDEEQEGGGKAA